MEQGHAVAAIDSVNLLVGNLSSIHATRYDHSDAGLTRFARDFYSYALNTPGRQDSPLGGHVNPYTAGGEAEGLTLTELAEKTGREKSNLSRTLKTMERYGLVNLERKNGNVIPHVGYSKISLDMALHVGM